MDKTPTRKFYIKHIKAIIHAIVNYEDLDLLLGHITEGTAKRFGAKGCSVMLLDENENQLVHIKGYGISEEYLIKGKVLVGKECALYTGEPVYVEDMQNSPLIQYPEAAAKEGFHSMLSIPIKRQNFTIGVLRIYHGEVYAFHEEDIDSLCLMSEVLSMVIDLNGLKNFLDIIKMGFSDLPSRIIGENCKP